MIETTATGCLVLLVVSMIPALLRIVRGPSVADRVVAADDLTTCIMAVVIVYSILAATRAYIDAIMALAILGFFGTVAFAKYIVSGRPVDVD